MELKEILHRVDHTLLTQTASWEEIKALCDDAIKYKTASVCIPASYVKQVKEYVKEEMAVCTVIGFPNGYNTTACKVFETCLLTEEEKIGMCRAVTAAGADYIKTSTGFSKAGATSQDVELFARHVGEGVKIKAAGGISSLADAEHFLELGADRLGTSRIVKIAKEL